MTGGYGMHIHGYQIQNVLNVYRQQLSRGTARNGSDKAEMSKSPKDRIDISDHGQRRSLFEKISAEIVQRITQFSPGAETEAASSSPSAETKGNVSDEVGPTAGDGPVFSYTLIDGDNQKTTQNLLIRQLNFSNKKIESLIKTHADGETGQDAY